jgi:hypothetical protein
MSEISILWKHSSTDAKDCDIRCNADFGEMTMTLYVDFISPYLLLSFLERLHDQMESFAKTEIIGAINITKRFDVRLELPGGTAFRLRAYHPFTMVKTQPKQIEFEFFELPKSNEDAPTARGENEINDLLSKFADGLVDRDDVQDKTGLSWGEILLKMRECGLTLPIVRTYDRYNDAQKVAYNEVFNIPNDKDAP